MGLGIPKKQQQVAQSAVSVRLREKVPTTHSGTGRLHCPASFRFFPCLVGPSYVWEGHSAHPMVGVSKYSEIPNSLATPASPVSNERAAVMAFSTGFPVLIHLT